MEKLTTHRQCTQPKKIIIMNIYDTTTHTVGATRKKKKKRNPHEWIQARGNHCFFLSFFLCFSYTWYSVPWETKCIMRKNVFLCFLVHLIFGAIKLHGKGEFVIGNRFDAAVHQGLVQIKDQRNIRRLDDTSNTSKTRVSSKPRTNETFGA